VVGAGEVVAQAVEGPAEEDEGEGEGHAGGGQPGAGAPGRPWVHPREATTAAPPGASWPCSTRPSPPSLPSPRWPLQASPSAPLPRLSPSSSPGARPLAYPQLTPSGQRRLGGCPRERGPRRIPAAPIFIAAGAEEAAAASAALRCALSGALEVLQCSAAPALREARSPSPCPGPGQGPCQALMRFSRFRPLEGGTSHSPRFVRGSSYALKKQEQDEMPALGAP